MHSHASEKKRLATISNTHLLRLSLSVTEHAMSRFINNSSIDFDFNEEVQHE